MTSPRKRGRESAAERDERIVRELLDGGRSEFIPHPSDIAPYSLARQRNGVTLYVTALRDIGAVERWMNRIARARARRKN